MTFCQVAQQQICLRQGQKEIINYNLQTDEVLSERVKLLKLNPSDVTSQLSPSPFLHVCVSRAVPKAVAEHLPVYGGRVRRGPGQEDRGAARVVR